ncbi:hypothetical protein FJV80_12155 [Mesorhizobium sp. WSM4310]|uniref:cupredoxin domain-containing protein n=1 Tax=Mesorhizobium sp. WSM4310 TaxID=2589883 RepID=UPI00115E5103|nr:hypothetical protein [Mesorhizobium sp. WSM4310]TRC87885.1 hypothetical protein FJV80_12155 [Mesorhizobium sp. WSM4310]
MVKTVIADITNNSFPSVTIPPNTYVVWRNLDPVPHTVETDPRSPDYFNVGPLATGEVSSPVLFNHEGKYPYQCRFHFDMNGEVNVSSAANVQVTPAQTAIPHGGSMGGMDHTGHMSLQHYHGFVTGGRSGSKLYMTHTPVIADDRHRFQIILRAHFVNPDHAAIYDKLRASAFGNREVQILHDHISLVDVGQGKITDLPECDVEYYPLEAPGGISLPGLEEKIPVKIDKVLHFHQFDPDAEYPDGLRYIVYGDADDVFIDHHIIGAPSFHSVARLASRPAFWTDAVLTGTSGIVIPNKRILDVSPKLLRRVAFVDNAYHLSWLPPSGAYRQPPPDPLIKRDGTKPIYDVVVDGGKRDQIEISDFVHFDVALLNNRVIIT